MEGQSELTTTRRDSYWVTIAWRRGLRLLRESRTVFIFLRSPAYVTLLSTVEIVGQSRNETGVRSEVVLVWVKARNICAGGRSMGSKELETESRTCL